MKAFIIFTALLSVTFAANIPKNIEEEEEEVVTDIDLSKFDNLKVDLPEELVEQIKQIVTNPEVADDLRSGVITAIVNDYADKIFANIQKMLVRAGVDPFALPDEKLGLDPVGSITLTSGWLSDISTMSRNGDLLVSYNADIKKVTFTVPVQFSALLFTYHYQTKVLLVSISGGVDGKVSNAKVNVILGFDWNTVHATVDKINMKNTGKISVHFTGHGLVDTITNAMTGVFTTVMHPIIIGIVNTVIKAIANGIVNDVNSVIDAVLHPAITDSTF